MTQQNSQLVDDEFQSKTLELARRKQAWKRRKQEVERQRVANESINTLLSVVRYLNAVQDGDALRIEADFSRTAIDKPSRILNCHEEDIMNASLITMRRLIESLVPLPKRTQPLVPAAESLGEEEPA